MTAAAPPVGPRDLRLGRVGDTEVRVAPSCLLVVVLIAVVFTPRATALVPGLGAAALLVGLAVGLLVYAAALVHEAAHAVVARVHGHQVPSIGLVAAGGRTHVAGETAGPREEATTAAAGPLVSLLIGLVALGVRVLLDDGVLALVLEALVVANLLIGLLDLVPSPPLDGGRLVRALGWRLTGSRARGSLLAARTGRVTAVVLGATPLVLLATGAVEVSLSAWVVCLGLAGLTWVASTSELAYDRLRAAVEGLPVADLARPPEVRHAVSDEPGPLPWTARADAVLPALVRRPGQDHVLVDDDGAVRGVLALADLEAAARR